MADDAHIPTRPTALDADGATLDLPQLVAALREARESQSEWQKAEAGLLPRPSRDALIAIVKGLRAALFPTHFSGADHTGASIDFYVGSVLDTTLRALQEQVRRTLSGAGPSGATHAIAHEAQRRVHAFARQLPQIRRLLELDIRAASTYALYMYTRFLGLPVTSCTIPRASSSPNARATVGFVVPNAAAVSGTRTTSFCLR